MIYGLCTTLRQINNNSSIKFFKWIPKRSVNSGKSPTIKFDVRGTKHEHGNGNKSWEEWFISLEGRKQMANWVGVGGSIAVLTGNRLLSSL